MYNVFDKAYKVDVTIEDIIMVAKALEIVGTISAMTDDETTAKLLRVSINNIKDVMDKFTESISEQSIEDS